MKGLENLGNTCYFNSGLQCLLQTPQLSNYLIFRKYTGQCEFTQEYQKVVKKMWINKGMLQESPQKLLHLFKKRYSQFDNTDQHDTQEMILCVLEILEKAIPFEPLKFPVIRQSCTIGSPHTLVKEIFYSQLLQETVCPTETTRSNQETNNIMVFTEKDTDVLTSLKDYTKWNVLEDFEDTNGTKQNVATTRNTFWFPPCILIIGYKMYTGKYRVSIEQELDISECIHPNSSYRNRNKYTLYGACKHQGSTGGGHYVSYTCHNKQWYYKNDCITKKVSGVPPKDYYYLLFYKLV